MFCSFHRFHRYIVYSDVALRFQQINASQWLHSRRFAPALGRGKTGRTQHTWRWPDNTDGGSVVSRKRLGNLVERTLCCTALRATRVGWQSAMLRGWQRACDDGSTTHGHGEDGQWQCTWKKMKIKSLINCIYFTSDWTYSKTTKNIPTISMIVEDRFIFWPTNQYHQHEKWLQLSSKESEMEYTVTEHPEISMLWNV